MNLYRSLRIERAPDKRLFKILELLAWGGYLQNNRQLFMALPVAFDCSLSSRFVEVICSVKNLEELDLLGYELAPDVLANVFQSCSKLIKLGIRTHKYKTAEMAEHLRNRLRSGFQKLRCLELDCPIDNDGMVL
jgi:hypothetical protein